MDLLYFLFQQGSRSVLAAPLDRTPTRQVRVFALINKALASGFFNFILFNIDDV
jgi:hypothetical protein